jgi:hypothetical protein
MLPSQPHPGTTAVLHGERDAGGFQASAPGTLTHDDKRHDTTLLAALNSRPWT